MSEASARRQRAPRAAFFDVDKTLLPGSSLYLFARGLYRRGFYTLGDVVGFAVGQLTFRLTGAEGRRGMEAARESALAFVEGKRRSELIQLGHDIVVEVIGPRIYPGMRKVIEAHRAAGDRTYLVTAAPRELAQAIATYLGMDGALGSEAELVNGVYTGRMVGPVLHGPAKLEAVRRLTTEQGVELRDCSAYSDSVNDRPLLEGVGHPVAVNPDHTLRRLADERGWPIHDFRRHRRLWLVWVPSGVAVGATAAAVAAVAAGRRRPRREELLAGADTGPAPPASGPRAWRAAAGGWRTSGVAARGSRRQAAPEREEVRQLGGAGLARLRRG
jgi:HAD superfamily hydrolase (TIGR01490 family)